MIKHSLPSAVALYSTEQIKTVESNFASDNVHGTWQLMEKAGKAGFSQLQQQWPTARKIIVVTGKGNNAGDGFIVAKLAAEQRIKVDLCCLVESDELSRDARKAFLSIPRRALKRVSIEQVKFSEYDVIVDAMLGTGINGPLREPYLSVVERINLNAIPVLSIDIPTGVEADTGFVHSNAIKADSTVTFVGHKKGIFTGDAVNYRGKVKLSSLQISERHYQAQTIQSFSHNWHSLKKKLKPRAVSSHKGSHGHTLVIGGKPEYAGAAVLAAWSAAKSGSGLTSAWVSENSARALNVRLPVVMAQTVDKAEIPQMLVKLEAINRTLVVGPGLGRESWAEEWIGGLSKTDKVRNFQQVWDADALYWLSIMNKSDINRINPNRILTPHPGEAAQLLNTSTHQINRDRYSAAQQIAEEYGGICILKGAGTIISCNKGVQIVCPVGNPGMASAGMGDVLAGLVGGLLAQKFSMMDAAALAVSIHGEAADRAAGPKEYYRGLLASDLLEYFPSLLNP
ncbi:MAG: NAD(P)H-hydrate dehydratase [Kangiellaceae bacterium]|nr:NAD(P)H-hydrate dehydratase [Kangiellaceae bacterium]